MPGFSITPVGPFPTQNDDGFPQFLQWQDEGINLGGPDAEVINLVGAAVTATRGTGEESNVVTIEVLATSLSLQFQVNGVDLGAPDATTLNFGGSLTVTRIGDTIEVNGPTIETTEGLTVIQEGDTITLGLAPFVWRDVPGDTTIDITDKSNGISCSGTSGAQVVTIPGDTGDPDIDLPDGAAILVYQEGAAGVVFQAVSGVLLRYRAALLAESAGQFATMTLIKRRTNEWVLCGDLAAA